MTRVKLYFWLLLPAQFIAGSIIKDSVRDFGRMQFRCKTSPVLRAPRRTALCKIAPDKQSIFDRVRSAGVAAASSNNAPSDRNSARR